MNRDRVVRILVVITAWWVVLMPFVQARNLSMRVGIDYLEFLSLYVPELVVAAACVVLLPGAWMLQRWAAIGLPVVALMLPVLKTWLGSPTYGSWPVSSALLLLLAWAAYSLSKREKPSKEVAPT